MGKSISDTFRDLVGGITDDVKVAFDDIIDYDGRGWHGQDDLGRRHRDQGWRHREDDGRRRDRDDDGWRHREDGGRRRDRDDDGWRHREDGARRRDREDDHWRHREDSGRRRDRDRDDEHWRPREHGRRPRYGDHDDEEGPYHRPAAEESRRPRRGGAPAGQEDVAKTMRTLTSELSALVGTLRDASTAREATDSGASPRA
ncbi:hypothetical protein [Streptomyces rimosus]|uniref:hypothetical protein n=1 Tax=Streptomyces rimosus TaxID=1927 RepID=UPI00067BFF59|nr:hypothetical protein [Streptomyces rimosus]